MINFWQNVKEKTKEQNTTQEWICNTCEIVLGTMRQQITHDRLPDVEQGYKIAKALNTTVEYLITSKNPSETTKYVELKTAMQQALDNH